MQVSLSPKHPDDPHDILVVVPDAISTAPGDEEITRLLREAARHRCDRQSNAVPEVRADVPAAASIPSVDTTFRPTAANDDIRLRGQRPSMGGRALRGFTALLLTAGICGAGIVWHASGDAAKKLIAKWGTQVLLASSSLTGSPAQPAASVVPADAANATDPQPAAPAQAAAETSAPAAAETAVPAAAPSAEAAPAAAPSAEQAQLQSMREEVASLGQQIEQLKATIVQLRAGQQQASREVAKVSDKASEPNLRAKKPSAPPLPPSALAPPRSAAAPVRRPMPSYYPPPRAAMAPAVSQAQAPYPPPAPYVPQAAPYVPPQQIDAAPPATAQTLADPELSSVPRPPMPLSR